MGQRWIYSVLFSLTLILFSLSHVWAGGALKTNINGLAFHWEQPVTLHPEQGSLKSGVYDRQESLALLNEALQTWSQVPGVNLPFQIGTSLPDGGDTTDKNYQQFYHANPWDCYDSDPGTPCYNPVLFDEDGAILEDMFGECAQFSILGFSGFTEVAGDKDDPVWTQLKRGQAIFSGACIETATTKAGCPPCNVVLKKDDVKTLVLHEIGHFLGLGHAQVNPDSYQSCLDTGVCSASVAEHIPTMFPFLVSGAKMLSLHRDDEISLQRLYGQPDNQHCSIAGQILAADGKSPLRGVELVARNREPEKSFTDAIAYVSGEEAPRIAVKDKSQDNCLENCGDFRLSGLRPGETYQICVQRVLSQFTGTRFVAPVDPPFQGVDQDCLQEQDFYCQCEGGNCSRWTGINIISKNDGLDLAYSQLSESAPRGAGCSLQRAPRLTQSWRTIRIIGRRKLLISS